MNTWENLIAHVSDIETKIGYVFRDAQTLTLAFVHRSYINENKTITEHNERLEFLGDSVLGLVIAEYLYRHLPTHPEGELSFLRSRLVDASSCVHYIQKLQVESFLLLGRGERMSQGRGRESILSDLFEALIGAIYLDGGFEAAKQFILSHFSEEISAILQTPTHNSKALLQDFCQKKFQATPTYEVVSEEGPEHRKIFRIIVKIQGQE